MLAPTRLLIVAAGLSWMSAEAPCQDSRPQRPADEQPEFARFVTEGEGGHLDTAIVRYRNADGVEVTVYGAVHIADPAHYASLQRRFGGHESLLYELVASPDHRPRPGDERRMGLIGLLQNGLKNSMGLQFQLQAVDYTKANFVHADLDPETFRKMQAENGESLLGLMWNAMVQGMAKARDAAADGELDRSQKFDLVSAFRSGEGRHLLRMTFATQLQDMEEVAAGFGGEKGSVLLEGRNEKCLEVLQQQIADGRKNLGIYYGAAHLPHMDKRLLELGFERAAHEWLVAWDCTKKTDAEIAAEAKARDAELERLREARREERRLRREARKETREIVSAVGFYTSLKQLTNLPSLADIRAGDSEAAKLLDSIGDDPWGHAYTLGAITDDPFRYEVRSPGSDGVAGTDDDVTAIGSLPKR